MILLMVAHKVMWVAVAFMATSYAAATWVVMPKNQGTKWVSVTLLAVSGGTLGVVFIVLGDSGGALAAENEVEETKKGQGSGSCRS